MEEMLVLNNSSAIKQTARRTDRPISNYTNHCKFSSRRNKKRDEG